MPFFLGASAAMGRGRGELLSAPPEPLFGGRTPSFLILLPSISSSTADAYASVTFPLTSPSGPISFPITTFVRSATWLEGLFNRLETSVLSRHCSLRSLAEWLEFTVPGRWRMTGSGSAFFVVVADRAEALDLVARISRAKELGRGAGIPIETTFAPMLPRRHQ